MGIPRYVVGAFLFGLIWAAIQYSQGRITDLAVLAIDVAVFTVFGSALCWGLQRLILWLKRRRG